MSKKYNEQIERAAKRLDHLRPEHIVCRYCGETSASGSFKGFCHKYGPTRHIFYPVRSCVIGADRSK